MRILHVYSHDKLRKKTVVTVVEGDKIPEDFETLQRYYVYVPVDQFPLLVDDIVRLPGNVPFSDCKVEGSYSVR